MLLENWNPAPVSDTSCHTKSEIYIKKSKLFAQCLFSSGLSLCQWNQDIQWNNLIFSACEICCSKAKHAAKKHIQTHIYSLTKRTPDKYISLWNKCENAMSFFGWFTNHDTGSKTPSNRFMPSSKAIFMHACTHTDWGTVNRKRKGELCA